MFGGGKPCIEPQKLWVRRHHPSQVSPEQFSKSVPKYDVILCSLRQKPRYGEALCFAHRGWTETLRWRFDGRDACQAHGRIGVFFSSPLVVTSAPFRRVCPSFVGAWVREGMRGFFVVLFVLSPKKEFLPLESFVAGEVAVLVAVSTFPVTPVALLVVFVASAINLGVESVS